MKFAHPLPVGTVGCAVCGGPVHRSNKGGEVRVAINIKIGGSMAISRPICSSCANKAASKPEGALEAIRVATPAMIAREEDAA
jgi:hypothetical protein